MVRNFHCSRVSQPRFCYFFFSVSFSSPSLVLTCPPFMSLCQTWSSMCTDIFCWGDAGGRRAGNISDRSYGRVCVVICSLWDFTSVTVHKEVITIMCIILNLGVCLWSEGLLVKRESTVMGRSPSILSLSHSLSHTLSLCLCPGKWNLWVIDINSARDPRWARSLGKGLGERECDIGGERIDSAPVRQCGKVLAIKIALHNGTVG